MQTISLVIMNTGPLDGTTPLSISETVVRDKDGRSRDPAYFGERPTFVREILLPASAGPFGVYDPGLGFQTQNKSTRLVSLAVIPATATSFDGSDAVYIIAPGGNRVKILDLARDNAIFPAIDLPVPVGHKLGFDTTGGAISGPYRIDMSFLPINRPGDFFGNLGD